METPSSESLGPLHVGRRSNTYGPFKKKNPLIFINESGVFGFNKGLSNYTFSDLSGKAWKNTSNVLSRRSRHTPLFYSFFLNINLI